MADLLTVLEHKGKLAGLKLVYVGDGNNVAHSLLAAGAKVGMDVVVSTPKGYEVDPVIFAKVQDAANETGATISLCTDQSQKVKLSRRLKRL